jgi:hypothetical protein
MVRRLPVVQNSDGPERPRWHWALIGAGFTVTLWLPLAVLGLWAGGVLEGFVGQSALARALPLVLSFLLASATSSTLLGRFGTAARRSDAVVANLVGSMVIVTIGGLSGDMGLFVLLPTLLILSLCSLLGGLVGIALGARLRTKIH